MQKSRISATVFANLQKIVDERYKGNDAAFLSALNNGHDKDIISPASYSRFKNGKTGKRGKGIDIDTLSEIADFLGVSVAELCAPDMNVNQKTEYLWSDVYKMLFYVAQKCKILVFQNSNGKYQDFIADGDVDLQSGRTIDYWTEPYSLNGFAVAQKHWSDNLRRWFKIRQLDLPDVLEDEERKIIARSNTPVCGDDEAGYIEEYREYTDYPGRHLYGIKMDDK